MRIEANSSQEYLANVPQERQLVFKKLYQTILDNLPKGYSEVISYGMIGFVVPHQLYPPGYHCDPKLPLLFINLANQKNFIAFYHMGIYSNPAIMTWFVDEYKKRCKFKLDMGKSCVRFKKIDDIPFDLIGELVSKISVKEWIDQYEKAIKK